MLFNINRQEDDPFTQLINQSATEAQNQQAQQQEKPYQFLQKVVSNEPKGKEEWVSPFRQDALSRNQNNRLYLGDAKNRKFPTVSATSAYSKQQPKDLGFKNIPKNAKRAKDIRFPTYLTKNEERQYQLLTELELKEKHLKYLKKCQKITDLIKDGNGDTASTTTSTASSSLSSSDDQDTSSAATSQDDEAATTTTANTDAEDDSSNEATSIEEEQDDKASETTSIEKATAGSEENIQQAVSSNGESNVAEPNTETTAATSQLDVPERTGTNLGDEPVPAVPEPVVTNQGDEPTPVVSEPEVTNQGNVSKAVATGLGAVPEPAVALAEEQKEDASGSQKDTSIDEKQAEGEEEEEEEETEQSSEDEHGEPTSTPETSEAESEENQSPIDPSKAPKVPFQERPKERTGIFALWKSHTSSSAQKGTATAPSNPVATPENPELIVKTTEHGYLSKAVYEKVNYDEKVHQRWLADLRTKEKAKYDAKNNEYKERLQDLQNQIDEIENSMKIMRKETSEKIEVNKNKLVKQIIDINAAHNNKKLMIFKDTENMKSQKLQEKDEVLNKQTNVKSEIDELNNEKTNVQKEFNDWTTNLSNLSQQLDAQIFKINQINLRQSNVQSEIDNLEAKKNELITQTEENKKLHEENVQVLESVENKEYLPQINDIDNQISTLLNTMTIIKQENVNEKTQLSAITKKLEDERRAHEEQLKLEAEERKRKEENLLEKQRQELEEQAHQAQLEHEEQITQVKQTYNDQLTELQDKLAAEEKELEAVKRERTRLQGEKAIEEQTRQKNADEALKQEILDKQHKQAEGIHAAEKNINTSNSTPQKKEVVVPKDDSLYEYHTEEDVMYA
ncbi:YGR130C [Saccharomyces arboricola H-6]|uniref:YGR130C n=1 Tax=Saccharomyces arboricola (strain H-6 / AS 2.3317 / CBS 10644) TaxID=1160507 RepID=J8PNG5_SACAR|nr:YGR130C [Saccharomyces arboricola H-6]